MLPIIKTVKGKLLISAALCLLLVASAFAWITIHSRAVKPPLQIIATRIASPPLLEDAKASIPPNASPEMTEFLENQAALKNNFARLHNQMLAANIAGTSSSTTQDLSKLFAEQNETLLQRQAQLSQIAAKQRASAPLPMPAPLQIPPNATPQMRSYLIARDQLTRDRIQTITQFRTADPKIREIAVQKWEKQNADRLGKLRHLAQALTNTNER